VIAYIGKPGLLGARFDGSARRILPRDTIRTKGERRPEQANLDKTPEWCLSGQQPAHYRSIAARARQLQKDATTPRLKQYLADIIVQCEQLTAEIEEYF
jgi:hypothetical protein